MSENDMTSDTNSTLVLVEECAGGTYFVENGGKRIGVFKPSEEEIGMHNNPKAAGEVWSIEQKGFEEGNGWIREIATYKIDQGWSGVPPTKEHEIGGKKGSYQDFCVSNGSLEDLLERGGSICKLSKESIHRIAILDLIILNCDRHDGNVLITDKGQLIPIDHGLCFPSCLESLSFAWRFWPQAKSPFGDEEKQWVQKQPDGRDFMSCLRKLGIDQKSAELSAAALEVLKHCIKYDWTARQLGDFWERHICTKPSRLELLLDKCKQDGSIDFDLLQKELEVLKE